jgi:hypothetical protein
MTETARARHVEELAERARLRLPLFQPGQGPPPRQRRVLGRPSYPLTREGHPHRATLRFGDFRGGD